jgi:hypothetical protein
MLIPYRLRFLWRLLRCKTARFLSLWLNHMGYPFQHLNARVKVRHFRANCAVLHTAVVLFTDCHSHLTGCRKPHSIIPEEYATCTNIVSCLSNVLRTDLLLWSGSRSAAMDPSLLTVRKTDWHTSEKGHDRHTVHFYGFSCRSEKVTVDTAFNPSRKISFRSCEFSGSYLALLKLRWNCGELATQFTL